MLEVGQCIVLCAAPAAGNSAPIFLPSNSLNIYSSKHKKRVLCVKISEFNFYLLFFLPSFVQSASQKKAYLDVVDLLDLLVLFPFQFRHTGNRMCVMSSDLYLYFVFQFCFVRQLFLGVVKWQLFDFSSLNKKLLPKSQQVKSRYISKKKKKT